MYSQRDCSNRRADKDVKLVVRTTVARDHRSQSDRTSPPYGHAIGRSAITETRKRALYTRPRERARSALTHARSAQKKNTRALDATTRKLAAGALTKRLVELLDRVWHVTVERLIIKVGPDGGGRGGQVRSYDRTWRKRVTIRAKQQVWRNNKCGGSEWTTHCLLAASYELAVL